VGLGEGLVAPEGRASDPAIGTTVNDAAKTKPQLIRELNDLRRRLATVESGGGAAPSAPGSCDCASGKIVEALRESERRYRLLAENCSDVIWQMDLELNRTYVSPSVQSLRGYTVEEVMHQTLDEICTPESAAVARRALADKLGSLQASPDTIPPETILELELNCKDGSTVWTEMSITVLFDESGRPCGIQGITRDITERRRADQALREAKRDAEEATLAKSQFLANMSHEIRTPMTAILGYVNLIGEGCPRLCQFGDDALHEYVRTISRNADLLLQVINDILDLSKIESGKMEIESIACSPVRIVEDSVALIQARATAKGLSVEVGYDDVPPVIMTDPTRLQQILLNLLSNAVKFTERGRIDVGLSASVQEDGRHELAFRVADTGIGIPADRLPGLFSPFTQADTSTTRRFGGTGLGLAISRRLTQMLGGELSVDTVEGEGSVFTATLVAEPATRTADAGTRSKSASGGPGLETREHAQPEISGRLLVVEDGKDNQRLLALLLTRAGAEVVVADNGQEGLDRFAEAEDQKRPFDLVLMDMQMPLVDGYTATARLRAQGVTTPIVAVTAHAMTGDRRKCLDVGCDGYLAKPIHREQLLHTVARHLARAATAHSVPRT
jgi:PAS domain S-box-containing protein